MDTDDYRPTRIVVYKDGTITHYKGRDIHRTDGPAVIEWNGNMRWYRNGHLYRPDGLPAQEDRDGRKVWHEKGQISRSNNLPAIVEANGDMMYLLNGRLHRTDGPAVVRCKGEELYYIHGEEISYEEAVTRGMVTVDLKPAR